MLPVYVTSTDSLLIGDAGSDLFSKSVMSFFVPSLMKSKTSKTVDFPELFSPTKMFNPLPSVIPSGIFS